MSFCERLQSARKEKGFTQKQVADAIGVAKSTYNGYENGSREPDLFKIKKLIELLGVSSSWLLGLDSNGGAGLNSFSGDSPTCCEFPRYLGESDPPTNSELELLRKLRALSPVHRAAIETLVGQFYPVDSGEKRGDISGTA